MSKLKRNDFLKLSAMALLAPVNNHFLLQAAPINKVNPLLDKDDLFNRLVIANDKEVAKLLDLINPDNVNFSRRIGSDFATLSASYSCTESKYYHNEAIVSKLAILTGVLHKYQTADGTVNIGNLESPPDTAFLIELLAAGASILIKDNSKDTTQVRNDLKKFLLRSGDALAVGGVHTPNHRWVICAALAQLNAIYPNEKYTNRIAEWLDEGVYNNSDGHYPERSRLYGGVENTSMLTMGRLLNQPALFEPVRKNLTTTYYYMYPNGDLATNDSRRQDQYISKTIISYYLHYRYLAIKDNNGNFAGIARLIEQMQGFEKEVLDRALFHFLENPALQEKLPPSNPPGDDFEKFFTTTQLLRIRRGTTSATLFGGADWPIIIASGRSNSPDFYAYRKGNAILKYLRLSSGFFSMGYFYSDGIRKDGKKYVLHKKLEIPYYQPLPKNLRNSAGDYKLSPSIDDRFWNKMDFENRPVSNVKTLETTVTFLETNDVNELTFQVTGLAGVPVTIELCFMEGGKLSGVVAGEQGNSFLENGMGKYEMGSDTIVFGPGAVGHRLVKNLEGERYSTHFGSLRTDGMHVYITGITPFSHTLHFS